MYVGQEVDWKLHMDLGVHASIGLSATASHCVSNMRWSRARGNDRQHKIHPQEPSNSDARCKTHPNCSCTNKSAGCGTLLARNEVWLVKGSDASDASVTCVRRVACTELKWNSNLSADG